MDWNKIYKIKDSVDVYLVDNNYIVVYFMNTRLQKKFRINDMVVNIFENIDGENSIKNIYEKCCKINHKVELWEFQKFFEQLIKSNILCEKIEKHLLTTEYRERYKRQLNYFTEFLGSELMAEEAQKKLQDSVISIIGCGAVGGNIALQLAMAGVENFILMDVDYVENSDCTRHMFFNRDSIGRKKVEVLGDKLKKINKNIKIFVYCQWLTPETDLHNLIDRSTFVVNTADEPYIGYTANIVSEKCVKMNKPHYIAGGFDAHLASTGELVIPYVTPCAACYSTFFAKKLVDWKPEKHPVLERANQIGGLPSMSLFSSSYACIEIVKYICGLIDMNKNYKTRGEFLFDGMELVYLHPEKNPNCKVCGGKNE